MLVCLIDPLLDHAGVVLRVARKMVLTPQQRCDVARRELGSLAFVRHYLPLRLNLMKAMSPRTSQYTRYALPRMFLSTLSSFTVAPFFPGCSTLAFEDHPQFIVRVGQQGHFTGGGEHPHMLVATFHFGGHRLPQRVLCTPRRWDLRQPTRSSSTPSQTPSRIRDTRPETRD